MTGKARGKEEEDYYYNYYYYLSVFMTRDMFHPSREWQLFNRIRGQDIRLLKQFSVGIICDLMVEKKKVKFGMK